MTNQWRSIAGSKWFLLAIVVMFMLISAGVRSYGIKDPWTQGHIGWSGYRSGNIARNYVRFGYLDTRLGAVRDVGPVRPDKFTYDEHPPMIYWLTSLSYHIFGVSEWSATLVPILCSALSLGLLFMIAFRWWGLSVAVLAAAFMALIPMDAYYGRMVDHEAVTLLFSLLTFYLYILWKEKRARGYLIGVFVALALAMLSDFPGYFVAPWLALYHVLTERRRKGRWTITISLLISGPLFFLVWAMYLRWISGSFDILTSRLAIRAAGGWGPWVFTLRELYRLQFLRLRSLHTSTLMLLSLVWTIFMAWDVWHKRDLERHGFVAVLGGFGVTYLALFHQNAYQHDFVAYYLTPFFCLASAWAMVLLIEKFLYGRWHILTALALIVFFAFFGEATASLRHLYWSRNADYVEVAQYLNSKLPEDGKVMAVIEDNIRNQWRFYLDRPSPDDVTDLPLLERRLADPAYRYFVLDTRLASKTTQELRDYLMRHYQAEVRGPFLIFDLHLEKPNLIGNRVQGTFESVTGEQFQSEYLTLLGYDMPSEVTWEQPPLSYRYLYSSDAYWPVGTSIPVQVTLYWRSGDHVPAGYTPAVTLRSRYDQTYQLEPVYAPQVQAYPPQDWEQGDVIRTDYFFSIPENYPSTRYTLSISWPGGEAESRSEADSDWIPVANLSVLPPSLPQPLDDKPQPNYPMVSTPVKGLKFLGYDLDRENVRPGQTVRLKTYWQVTQQIERDYALLARLQNGDFTLTEPFESSLTRLWDVEEYYQVDLNLTLPPDILAGQYPLTLKIRGEDKKGSLPLTTLQVTTDQQIGLIRRWGHADGVGDGAVLSPEKPLRLTFYLREPRALNVIATWTGRSELDRTRIEVYVVNDEWYAPRKYLTTWVVGQEMWRSSWAYVPKSLSREGLNTIELRVPSPLPESHPLGWRGSLDALIPGILQDPGTADSGAVEVDFVQVSSARSGDSWEEFYNLAVAYAERNMWGEVKHVYRKAHERGASPTSPLDLDIFFEAEKRSPDADLRSQLESRLAGLTPNKTSIILGDQVEFIGYDIERVSTERVRIQFFFWALESIPEDYTVWVHATPHDPANLFGKALETGYFALDHALPTSTWEPGGIYRESYGVVLPPGDYDFSLGLWRWQDGSRLWRKDYPDAHTIELNTVSLP